MIHRIQMNLTPSRILFANIVRRQPFRYVESVVTQTPIPWCFHLPQVALCFPETKGRVTGGSRR